MISSRTIERFLERGSVKSFQSNQILEKELADILHTAEFAPSAMGLQTRHFTVIQDEKLISNITDAAIKWGTQFEPDYTPFYHAPTVIVLSAPKSARYCREDCACAIMSLMLSAHTHGLGSCYIYSVLEGLRDDTITERLEIPKDYIPFGCVSIGYISKNVPTPQEDLPYNINYIK